MKLVGIKPEISQRLGAAAGAWGRDRRRIFVFMTATVAASMSLALAPNIEGMMGAALAFLMAAIASIDASHYIIPDELTAVSLALGLLHAAFQGDDSIMTAVALAAARSAITAGVFWSIKIAYRRLRGREGLGLGDIKLAGAAGAWLGWNTIPIAIEIAALSGLGFYVIRQYLLGRPLESANRLPFGACLAPTIWVGWLFEIIMRGTV